MQQPSEDGHTSNTAFKRLCRVDYMHKYCTIARLTDDCLSTSSYDVETGIVLDFGSCELITSFKCSSAFLAIGVCSCIRQ